jgi:4-amino-4-deoxy-L-arabinose transferase-like glycosyltransferase
MPALEPPPFSAPPRGVVEGRTSGTRELNSAHRVFWLTFGGTLVLKLVLAAGFPFTGDEAFFYQWGVFPAWGYSDHPPMVGWWLALLRALGEHPLVLRSGTLLLTSLIALGLVDLLLRQLPAERAPSAWLAGAVYLALPWSWLFVLVTTDTPLVFFMALSAGAYLRADARDTGSTGWYALAGLFVGLAFLSKYFAALLGLAYAVHILGWRRARRWALPLMLALALPSIGLNLWFNAHHGWANVMFNLFNRNAGLQWKVKTVAVYAALLVYLLTPWLLWQALRTPVAAGVSLPWRRAVAVLWVFPLLVFAWLSLRRSIGLHWVLGFVPLFVLWAGLALPAPALRRSWHWTLLLSVPHLLLVAALAWAPLSWWQASRLHQSAVFLRETPALVGALRQDLAPGATLMARAYSPAALLAYHHGTYVPVFGVGRHHARQDDQRVDFRAFEGQTLRIFADSEPALSDFTPYFEQVRVRRIDLQGVAFYAVDGVGFRYPPYRDRVLSEVARQFHDIPRGLPLLGNPFCERYGFAACSPGR